MYFKGFTVQHRSEETVPERKLPDDGHRKCPIEISEHCVLIFLLELNVNY